MNDETATIEWLKTISKDVAELRNDVKELVERPVVTTPQCAVCKEQFVTKNSVRYILLGGASFVMLANQLDSIKDWLQKQFGGG